MNNLMIAQKMQQQQATQGIHGHVAGSSSLPSTLNNQGSNSMGQNGLQKRRASGPRLPEKASIQMPGSNTKLPTHQRLVQQNPQQSPKPGQNINSQKKS